MTSRRVTQDRVRPDTGVGHTARKEVTYRVGYGGGRAAWARLPAPPGRHLAGAYETTFGDLCEIVQLWEPPVGADAAALGPDLPAGVRDRRTLELVPLAWSP